METDKLLVHITVDIWHSGIPEIKTEKISNDAEKCVYVWRAVKPRREIRRLMMERPVQKNKLDQARSHAPGVWKYHFIADKTEDIRTSPGYVRAVTENMAKITGEINTAWDDLDVMDDGLRAGG